VKLIVFLFNDEHENIIYAILTDSLPQPD